MLSGAGAVALPLQAATLAARVEHGAWSDALRDHDDTDRPLRGLDRAQRIHHACAALTAVVRAHALAARWVGRGTSRHPRGPWRKRRGARLQARRQLRGRQVVVHRAHEPRDARHDGRGEARAEILAQLVRVAVLARNRGPEVRRGVDRAQAVARGLHAVAGRRRDARARAEARVSDLGADVAQSRRRP